jgi:hypothetical protein
MSEDVTTIAPIDAAVRIGHVHLKVSDLDRAKPSGLGRRQPFSRKAVITITSD